MLQRLQPVLLAGLAAQHLFQRQPRVFGRHIQPHAPIADGIGVDNDFMAGLLRKQRLQRFPLNFLSDNDEVWHASIEIMLGQKRLHHRGRIVSFRILREKTFIPQMAPSPDHGKIYADSSTPVILGNAGDHIGIQRIAAIHELFFADFSQ